MELPTGFTEPDWTKPLDIDEYRERTPEDTKLRGRFFSLVQEQARSNGVEPADDSTYYAFKLYPVHRYYDLVEDVVPQMYPSSLMRQAIRKLGQAAYPAFAETRTGRFLFGLMGKNPQRIFSAAGRAYGVTITRGTAEVLESSEQQTIIRLTDMHTFLDAYHVGLLEGVLKHTNCVGRVGVRMRSPSDGDLAAIWVRRFDGRDDDISSRVSV